jgi:hypothetical protein
MTPPAIVLEHRNLPALRAPAGRHASRVTLCQSQAEEGGFGIQALEHLKYSISLKRFVVNVPYISSIPFFFYK